MGVSTGRVLLSVHGGAERLYCGAMGDVINLASRVQSVTGAYGARVLLTGQTLAALRAPRPRPQSGDIYAVLTRPAPG